jgi:hypothetical protein
MSFTLTQLQDAIKDYTENQESTFVSNLNIFIRGAEERIFKSVQLNFFRRNQTGTLTVSNKFLNCPSDFLAPYSLSIIDSNGDHQFLDYKDVNFLQSAYPDPTATGTPRYYAFFDVTNFLLAPTPSAALTAELHYYYRPTSLTAGAGSGTTWLSTNAPLAMLYGSLIEAYTYMKGEADIIQNYTLQFQESIGRLKNYGEAVEDTDAYRTGLIIRDKI